MPFFLYLQRNCDSSSVGRALASQAKSREFESRLSLMERFPDFGAFSFSIGLGSQRLILVCYCKHARYRSLWSRRSRDRAPSIAHGKVSDFGSLFSFIGLGSRGLVIKHPANELAGYHYPMPTALICAVRHIIGIASQFIGWVFTVRKQKARAPKVREPVVSQNPVKRKYH